MRASLSANVVASIAIFRILIKTDMQMRQQIKDATAELHEIHKGIPKEKSRVPSTSLPVIALRHGIVCNDSLGQGDGVDSNAPRLGDMITNSFNYFASRCVF